MRKFVIVGLGLIGGSMAMALKGFRDFEIIGVARRQATADYANSHGVGDRAVAELGDLLSQADVTMLCMDPDGIVSFLREHKDQFKPGSLVTDVGGVKSAIMAGARVLPEGVDFIGCHPMAGTEFSGVEHAFGTMFQGSHLILTPGEHSTEAHVALMEELASYIGCRDVTKTSPQRHDQIVAYTSQMMHVIALSVCDDDELFACRGYEGSSFRGCTRVAALDAPLWTQLFSLNSPALLDCVDRLIGNLQSYRDIIASGDRKELLDKLTVASDRKKQVNLPGPDLLK